MRRLYYVKLVHKISEDLMEYITDPEQRRFFQRLHETIKTYNNQIARDLVEINRGNRIDKVYAEGIVHQEDFVPSGQDDWVWIADVLVKECCSVGMATEHPLLPLFHEYLLEVSEKAGRNPIGLLDTKNLNKLFLLWLQEMDAGRVEGIDGLKNFLESEGSFDVQNVRDKYIALNVDRTLEEDENGVLLMGRLHKVDEQLKKMGSTIDVVTLDYSSWLETEMKIIGAWKNSK